MDNDLKIYYVKNDKLQFKKLAFCRKNYVFLAPVLKFRENSKLTYYQA